MDGCVAVLAFNYPFIREWRTFPLSGFPVMFAYIAVLWAAGFAGFAPSVYEYECKPGHVLQGTLCMLVCADALQTAFHFAAHSMKPTALWRSHQVHHRHVNPTHEDAYDTGFLDAVVQMVLPVHLSIVVVQPGRFALIAFGCVYSSWLLYIHDNRNRRVDAVLSMLGFVTPAYHLVHHRKKNRNFANIFRVWDVILFPLAFNS